MNLTDTEIVAACARAMGLKPFLQCEHLPLGGFYNPITDRAQAMELVEKLLLQITRADHVNVDQVCNLWEVGPDGDGCLAEDTDLLRAICLCAARVQIEKEKNRG